MGLALAALSLVRRIRLGTLDGDPGRRAFAHFWVSEKAPWFEITGDLPQYPADTIPE